MSAKILDGRALAAELNGQLQQEVLQYCQQGKRRPGLAVVLVGEDPASQIYVKHKTQAARNAGMLSTTYSKPNTTSQAELLALINNLNLDPTIDGILVQLPLPKHIDAAAILAAIAINKDVDGFHPSNIGKLLQGYPTLRCCTPFGIMLLLAQAKIQLEGIHAVVIGASNIVGKPMAAELINSKATVCICHKRTKNLRSQIEQADLLIVAAGCPGLIYGSWLKPGVIVVDVGINRLTDGSIVGDVDFASAVNVASWITPVPGGVGPMTVAALLRNTVSAYRAAIAP